jgi:hypothetical protein
MWGILMGLTAIGLVWLALWLVPTALTASIVGVILFIGILIIMAPVVFGGFVVTSWVKGLLRGGYRVPQHDVYALPVSVQDRIHGSDVSRQPE